MATGLRRFREAIYIDSPIDGFAVLPLPVPSCLPHSLGLPALSDFCNAFHAGGGSLLEARSQVDVAFDAPSISFIGRPYTPLRMTRL